MKPKQKTTRPAFGCETAADPRWEHCGVNPLHVRPLYGADTSTNWSCKKWDDIEDLKLLMWKGTDEDLAKKLGRTVAGVRLRRHQLEKEENG